MEDKHDLIKHVRLLITASLGSEPISADRVARELNMTRRNLHQHLDGVGTSFKELKNDVMVEIAKEALAETDSSITDIGLQLGYAEISPFIRAFKRLTGVTPLQYRKAN